MVYSVLACAYSLVMLLRSVAQDIHMDQQNTEGYINTSYKFEPGYTRPSKPSNFCEISSNIRKSLEVSRENVELQYPRLMENISTNGVECRYEISLNSILF